MLLLAVDTSGKNGSLALARVVAGKPAVEVVEEVALTGGNLSAQLVPQTISLLDKYGYSKSDLSGFAVASGPGSFTGLRVGLAAIKAMAEILRQPIAAISLLEAVARSGASEGRVLSLLEAGRSELYVGDYELGPPVRMLRERLLGREELVAEHEGQLVVAVDANIADAMRAAGLPVKQVGYPTSGEIARLGWERIQRGETVLPENLEANYIRRSDAEIFFKPKA
ncbi:MAG: tRNA (adenosine(37)-N6)-threonylcarbamoyltransferase complex dimerization subunit type 1 TsaB [Acidobacteria bacterium]|nr:tRNA (adenosine(37)-N6)-threonylcarbamoyltransferase complex dimerization subunit type 1 TsaB [Acidobacteriota bacterium]